MLFYFVGVVSDGLGDDDEVIGLAILFSCGLLTLIILAVALCVCRFRQNRRQASTTTRVNKNGAEVGNRVAAEAVLTNSSDLHCCGHVTSIIRDDHKQRAHNGNSICLSNIGQWITALNIGHRMIRSGCLLIVNIRVGSFVQIVSNIMDTGVHQGREPASESSRTLHWNMFE